MGFVKRNLVIRIAGVIAGVLLIALGALWLLSKVRCRHSGDAAFIDRGVFSYRPLYEVNFQGFSITNSVKHVFAFNCMPSADMTFSLEIVPYLPTTDLALQALTEQRTDLRVRIENERGDLIAMAQGPLKAWVLARSSAGRTLWHPSLRDLKFPDGSFRLTIEVSNGPTNDSTLFVQPTFTGGGSELP